MNLTEDDQTPIIDETDEMEQQFVAELIDPDGPDVPDDPGDPVDVAAAAVTAAAAMAAAAALTERQEIHPFPFHRCRILANGICNDPLCHSCNSLIELQKQVNVSAIVIIIYKLILRNQ